MRTIALRFRSFVRDNMSPICFIIGFVCVLIPCVLFVSSGSNYAVVPFDQLDGVIEKYQLSILHAEDEIAPELMGGTPVVDLSNGTFIPRMLFTFFPAYLAYSLLVSFVLVVSYIGMFLLLHEVNVRALLCMISAIGFASFPFFASMGSLNWVITYQTVSAVCLKKKCELPWYNFRTPLDGEAR